MFKYSFKNLGPIVEGGELELADLTVLCGHNNTGKTYIAYSLYGFLTSINELISNKIFESFKGKITSNVKELKFPIDINIGNDTKTLFQEMLNSYVKESLADDLAAPDRLFKNTKIDFNLNNSDNTFFSNPLEITFSLLPPDGHIFSLKKEPNSYNITLNKIQKEEGEDNDIRLPIYFLAERIARVLNKELIMNIVPNVFIASAERTGSLIFKGFFQQADELPSLFRQELESFSKIINERFELNDKDIKIIEAAKLQASSMRFGSLRNKKSSEQDNALNAMDKNIKNIIISQQVIINETPYRLTRIRQEPDLPKAVLSNMNYLRRLDNIQKEESFILKQHPDLLNDFNNIAGGQYVINDGILTFQPHGTKLKLSMETTSSAVRSLALLNFYLRHTAKEGDLLMIDEPEINLHPANQRLLARFLVKLTGIGIKVFITTHSSVIVREFNNQIMLHKLRAESKITNDQIKETGYFEKDEGIAANNINLYMLLNKNNKIVFEKAKRKGNNQEYGFVVSSFDDTNRDISNSAQYLAGLFLS